MDDGSKSAAASVPVQKEERTFELGGGYTATVSRMGRSRLGPIVAIFGMDNSAAQMASMDMVFRAGVAGKITDGTGKPLACEMHPVAGKILAARVFDDIAIAADPVQIAELSAFVMEGISGAQQKN